VLWRVDCRHCILRNFRRHAPHQVTNRSRNDYSIHFKGTIYSAGCDEKRMLPGDDIYAPVNGSIRIRDKVLWCCSKHSLSSWWVDNEIETAVEKQRMG
jgi:hypothetical protein